MIRVETALSKFPLHRLAKAGVVEIVIREQNAKGDFLRWKVSHNSEYGQPGPLAYKLDTLVVNRRIEEAGRPLPRIIRLGSLKDICRELGLAESGANTNKVKRALLQNAFAAITGVFGRKPTPFRGGRKPVSPYRKATTSCTRNPFPVNLGRGSNGSQGTPGSLPCRVGSGWALESAGP